MDARQNGYASLARPAETGAEDAASGGRVGAAWPFAAGIGSVTAVSADPSLAIWLAVILLSALSGVTTLIGVGLALWLRDSAGGIATGIGFSAGIMLLISTVELIPESASQVGLVRSLVTVALGGAVVASLHAMIPHTHLIEEKGKLDPRLPKGAYLVAFGLILHDFPEGFAMANSYVASPSLGLLVALAIALHNIPEEFAMAAPAVAVRNGRFLFRAAVLSALAEPAGALLGLFAVHLDPGLNPLLMAFAAGVMIFVSLHELVPMAQRYGKIHLFALGAGVSVLGYLLLSLAVP
jgi:ZIP family zinc transporter